MLGKQTVQIQTHELYWPHITKQCNTHQLTKSTACGLARVIFSPNFALSVTALLERPKHSFSSKTKMTLQEVTSSLQEKTGIHSQGREDTVLLKYLCSLQFCHLIHSSKTTVPMVLEMQSAKCRLQRVKTAWGQKNMLKACRVLEKAP